MKYAVSNTTQEIFETVLSLPEVQKALDFIREDYPASLKEHKKFVACESPSFHEEKRADLYADALRDNGLEFVKVDEYTNVTGWLKGEGNGPTVLIEAHMDTVFPFGSVGEIKDDGECMYAPGVTDDTRGMTAILAALRAIRASGLTFAGDIVFGGTSREEGMGDLGGMKDLVAHGPHFDGSISVDGASTELITCEATGIRTYCVTFHGKGGHAYSAFGTIANPLHAAARAVAKIADLAVAESPRTTFAVTNFHAGTDAGVHAIVPEATIKFNFRSNDQELLLDLEKRIFQAIEDACQEETARWGKDTITWTSEKLVSGEAGKESHSLPLVEAAALCADHFSPNPEKVQIREGGSVNGNVAIAAGIPCVTIGGGDLNRMIHSVDEYFPYREGWRLPQEIVVLLAMAAGVSGKTEPVVKKRKSFGHRMQ